MMKRSVEVDDSDALVSAGAACEKDRVEKHHRPDIATAV
jgi:hypothetical protein